MNQLKGNFKGCQLIDRHGYAQAIELTSLITWGNKTNNTNLLGIAHNHSHRHTRPHKSYTCKWNRFSASFLANDCQRQGCRRVHSQARAWPTEMLDYFIIKSCDACACCLIPVSRLMDSILVIRFSIIYTSFDWDCWLPAREGL